MQNIQLTASMRANLLSLQGTATLLGVTQERLSTGRKVNSAQDDATAYFSAQQGFQKASDLNSLKNDMGEALQKIKTATTALESVSAVLQQMKGLVSQALSTSDATTRDSLSVQFDDLNTQLGQLTANDANYKGTNLLAAANDLDVNFNESGLSKITIKSTDVSKGSYAVAASANKWLANADITAAQTAVNTASVAYQNLSRSLAASSTYIQTRVDFTTKLASTFQTGAENLVSADMNEEGANMLALQTRQQLGITSLSLASQANQSILKLF